jgi:hypothetical protein
MEHLCIQLGLFVVEFCEHFFFFFAFDVILFVVTTNSAKATVLCCLRAVAVIVAVGDSPNVSTALRSSGAASLQECNSTEDGDKTSPSPPYTFRSPQQRGKVLLSSLFSHLLTSLFLQLAVVRSARVHLPPSPLSDMGWAFNPRHLR